MRGLDRFLRIVFVVAVAVSGLTAGAHAQSATTGALTGTIFDPQDRVLPDVAVTAVHEPTGSRYATVTDGAGYFQIPSVRVGGPYTVTMSLDGFAERSQSGIFVGLGEARSVVVHLALATVQETVTVRGVAASPIDGVRAGTAANILPDVVSSVPTIQRSIIDIAQISPYVNAFAPPVAGSDSSFSIGAKNARYNSMQIDGAASSDLFGISTTGFPGGPAGPLSLDAIGEVQVVVAPYDVRQGSFSAGGVNIVTRSGGNAFSGTGYGFGRTEQLIGTIPDILDASKDTRVGSFSDHMTGFSLGGPMVRDRGFFFGNVEIARRSTPWGFSVSGDSGQQWGNRANVEQVLAIMQNQYGYNPGGLDQSVKRTDSEKFLMRADVNLASAGRLTFRVNDVDLRLGQGTPPSTMLYVMPSAFSRLVDSELTTVGQLNTAGARTFNEFRVGWQRGRVTRSPQPGQTLFPAVRVDFADGTSLQLGSDPAAHANGLNQDGVEVTDDFTWSAGTHTLTAGTHNEFLRFNNLFIQNLYGSYRFSSIDNLRAGFAQAFSRTFSNTSDPLQAAAFSVRQFGLYLGDQWRARRNVTLTVGLRLDVPRFPDTPHANPLALSEFGYATNFMPSPSAWSPRAGFAWGLGKEDARRSQIRGGLGLFSGRPPYVWMSDEYANTGVDFTSVAVTLNPANRIPFVADPFRQPSDATGAGRQTINLVDPRFQFPSVLQGNLAYDRELALWGLVGIAELLVSKTVNDVTYTNVNYVPTGVAPDGRLTYTKEDATLNDVILLANTSAGHQWTASVKVERPSRGGLYLGASYLFNRARSVNDAVSGIAANNWGTAYTSGDVNNPPVTRSVYDVGHRITVTATIPVPLLRALKSAASVYYNSQSGQPYVLVFNNDANGDGRPNNDIVFAPLSSDQVAVTGGTWAQLDAYLGGDPSTSGFRGHIPPRNAGRAPWSHSLNARYLVTVPTGGRTKLELTMDVVNVLNLLNRNWGAVYYPNVSGPQTIAYGGIDKTTGQEIFNLSTITAATFAGTFNRDDLRSRWQAQWGVRVRF